MFNFKKITLILILAGFGLAMVNSSNLKAGMIKNAVAKYVTPKLVQSVSSPKFTAASIAFYGVLGGVTILGYKVYSKLLEKCSWFERHPKIKSLVSFATVATAEGLGTCFLLRYLAKRLEKLI